MLTRHLYTGTGFAKTQIDVLTLQVHRQLYAAEGSNVDRCLQQRTEAPQLSHEGDAERSVSAQNLGDHRLEFGNRKGLAQDGGVEINITDRISGKDHHAHARLHPP